MLLDPERFRRIESLFGAAVDLDPVARARYLERECAGDDALRRAVESLVRHDTGSTARLGSPIAAEARAVLEPEPRRERIGHYRIVREIGRGGMGAVYLAARADEQYTKEVAIKLVPGAPDSADLLQRFRGERQILATLEHPNIARLLDGGATEDGLPYLVMEYVDGEPIDAYCDRLCLTVEQRLGLFLDLCAAVQHAHGRLIVHRDIKPGNVLVTPDGTPKLLDFGIAKLLDPSASGYAVTGTAQRLMTPEYASPEQVRGEPVGTTTDVYALGMLLYELLAGRPPFTAAGRSLEEIARVVCEESPERPSSASIRQADAAHGARPTPEEVAGRRGTRPEALCRRLSGDLDDIVQMALRKEPERRYASVDRLAADVRRHLDGLPVAARPDTWSYRSAKYVRRHRLGLGAAAVALFALVAFGVAMAAQARRISRERDTAERVTEFLIGMFEVADPGEERADRISARDILERGTARIRGELHDSPAVRERLLGTLGEVNRALGAYEASVPLLEERLALSRELYGPRSLEHAVAMNQLGSLHQQRGRHDEAAALVDPAMRLHRELLGPDDPRQLDVMFNAAMVRFDTGRAAEAQEILLDAHRIATATGAEQESTGHALHLLAVARHLQDDFAGAVDYESRALELRRKLLGDEHIDVAESWHGLAASHARAGDLAASLEAARESLRIRRALFPENHPSIAIALSTAGNTARDLGDLDTAIAMLREGVAILRRVHPEGHAVLADTLTNLGLALNDAGVEGAEPLLLEALAMDRKLFGEEHTEVGWSWSNLGWFRYGAGRCAEAAADLTRAVGILSAAAPPDPFASVTIKNLGLALDCEGEAGAAEKRFRQAVAHGREHLPPGHPFLGTHVQSLGSFLVRANRLAEAETTLREAMELRTQTLPEGHFAIASVKTALGECLLRLGRWGEAEPLLLAGHASDDRRTKERARAALAKLYTATNRPDRAAAFGAP